MAEDERVDPVRLEHRLRVVPRGGAGRRVPRVPDREVAVQRRQRRLVEDLADQPEILVDEDVVTVADRDPGGLLAPMLLCEQPEVREPGDVLAGCPHPEEPALLLR